MNTILKIIVYTTNLILLGHTYAAPPNPSGIWDLRWNDRSYGVAFYEGDEKAHVGEEFVRPSDYHAEKFLDELASINSLVVTYVDGASTVTLSGAGEAGVRTLEVQQLASEDGWQATARTPLATSLDTTDLLCFKFLSYFERIRVTETGNLTYHRKLELDFVTDSCKPYFTSLAEDFDFTKSGAILAAVYDSGAIDLSRLSDLEQVQEIIIYQGTRKS